MNPYQFLALTPKSNCGACGHATCLAFAVAVTKGGVSPSHCPHLDASRLPREMREPSSAAPPAAARNELALAGQLKGKIHLLDFKKVAQALGATWRVEPFAQLLFPYLGREVVLGKDLVTIAGHPIEDPRDLILLYNYVFFGGGRWPDGTWLGLESLPNSISKVTTLATYCELPLATRFSGRAARLAEICDRLGGHAATAPHSAAVAAIVPVLPTVPHYLLFWDGVAEEGFSAKVKILFDHHVLDHLDLESLVFAAERLAEAILSLDSL